MKGLVTVLYFVSALAMAAQEPVPLLIEKTAVIDVQTGVVLRAQDIIIKEGKIASVMPHAPGTAATEKIDGRGRYVIPGLWDSHVHATDEAQWQFPLFLRYGVLAIRDMPDSDNAGAQQARKLKKQLSDNAIAGPAILLSGQPVARHVPLGSDEKETVASYTALLKQRKKAGADFAVPPATITAASFALLAQASSKVGLPLAGIMPYTLKPADAVTSPGGLRTVEFSSGLLAGCAAKSASMAEIAQPQSRLDVLGYYAELASYYEPDNCKPALDAYKTAGVAVTPMLMRIGVIKAPAQVLDSPDAVRLLPENALNKWHRQFEQDRSQLASVPVSELLSVVMAQTRQATESGVTLLAGSDAGAAMLIPGLSLHQELTMMAEAGIPLADILKAATINPAQIFGFADSQGQVKGGFAANLVILDKNPLTDIAALESIEGIVLKGKYLSREQLDAHMPAH